MANNEKNLCNVMREEWRLLTTLVNNAAQILRKILNHIRSLVNRLANSYFALIGGVLRDIRDMVSAYLGLAMIDQSMARQELCRMMYQCKPAIDIVLRNVNKGFYNWLYEPSQSSSPDLSKWGIPAVTVQSRYEAFEYVACRLSLNNLYNNFTDKMINNLMDFLNDYKKYLTMDWLLEHTMPGRVLMRAIKDYEDFFKEYIQKYLDKLVPYLNCAFAMCDFGVSTQNFFDDFRRRYAIGLSNAENQVGQRWTMFRDELLDGFSSTLTSIQNDVENIVPSEMQASKENTESNETTPYNSSEVSKYEANAKSTNPSAASSSSNIPYNRDVENLKTPNSVFMGDN